MKRDRDSFNGDAIGCALGLSMTAVVALCIAAMCLLLGGCSTSRKIPAQRAEYKSDSVRVEVRERTVFVPDTVYVDIPSQVAERTTSDSVSRIENDYSVSEAQILPNGQIRHILATKPQKKPAAYARQIEYRDSIVYRDRAQIKTVTKTVQVARKRPWWEKAEVYGFWAAVGFIAIVYRKKIISCVVHLFVGK